MASHCIYGSTHGDSPNCDYKCKKSNGSYCEYFYVDLLYDTIKEWKKEAKYDYPVMIKKDYNRKKLVIYTERPGILIGCKGVHYFKYKELLKPMMTSRFVDHEGIPKLDEFIEFVECDDVI